MCTHVNSSIFRNCQNVKTTQMFITWWTDKTSYIIQWNKKEWIMDTCYNMNEPWIYYAKWKKHVTKHHIFHDSIYMKYIEQANLSSDYLLFPRTREMGVGGKQLKGFFFFFRDNENVLNYLWWSCTTLNYWKIIEFCTLNGWIVWYVNYLSKLLPGEKKT